MGNAMVVSVKIIAPKRIKGDYKFGRLEELYLWLIKNRIPKGYRRWAINQLAKVGRCNAYTGRLAVKMAYENYDYFLHGKLATKHGLIRGFRGTVYNPSDQKILAFTKDFDAVKSKAK